MTDKKSGLLDINEIFGVTKEAESGKWFEFTHPDTDEPLGISMKLAKTDNSNFRKLQKKLLISNRRVIQKLQKLREKKKSTKDQDDRLDEIESKNMIQLIAETVIIDWKGIGAKDSKSGKIKKVPFSSEMAITILNQLPMLRDIIVEFAGSYDEFSNSAKVEDALGN